MVVRRNIKPGFRLIFWREVGWLRRRPFLLGLTTVVPLVLVALLSGIFSAGLATRLPIGVLDLDGSDLSRTIIRMVDATPDTAVAARSDILPIPVQIHPLFNPTLNYIYFLLTALIPSILQVVIVTASSYSVGLDVETRHRLRILRRLAGGLWPAMAGKILPYTIIFLLVLGLSDTLLFAV